MTKQTESIISLFDTLYRVPESRKKIVLRAVVEYLDVITQMRSAGANTAEIEAAGDPILKKYRAMI